VNGRIKYTAGLRILIVGLGKLGRGILLDLAPEPWVEEIHFGFQQSWPIIDFRFVAGTVGSRRFNKSRDEGCGL